MKKNFILKNKIIFTLLLCILITTLGIFSLSTLKNKNINKQNNNNNVEKETNKLTFPYIGDEGKVRYKLVINNIEVETKNYPFKLNEEDKGSYYPLKDVLNYFDIESLVSDDNTILTTKINGNIIRVDADQGKMRYGKIALEALDGNIKTILVNNVLYVPSFFFMNLTDNSIVNYSSDGTSATLDTDLIVEPSNSGTSGLSLVETNSNGGELAGNGYHICPTCGGAGGSNTAYFEQRMVNGKHVLVTKYRWQHCPVCGGTGHIH